MIKVLIVDDEPKLREGLRLLIPWEELGYTVVATASSGIEGLKQYQLFAPELIIADIRMPGMDGLRMLSELRQGGEECHVLILSGHADFEYAKQAITHRADGYLLKPVDEDELIDYLNKLRETIQNEALLKEQSGPDRDTLLYQLLQPGGSREAADEAAVLLGVAGRETEVVLIELKRPLKKEEERQEREERARQALQRRWSDPERGLFFVYPPYLGLLLTEPLQDQEARAALWGELERIMLKENLEFFAAAGGAVSGAGLSVRSCAAARELLGVRFFGAKGELLSGDSSSWPLPSVHPGEASLRDEEHRLLLAVESGSAGTIEDTVTSLLGRLAADKQEERTVKDQLMRIVSGISARLESAYPESRPMIEENQPALSQAYTADYLSEFRERLIAYLERVAEGLTAGRGDELKRILDLIQRRYSENLKLGTLADMFNYNSAYLGKMFKNYTGEHFNTYLDKVRIENAKQFLAQGMKVYEVAERVGYVNPDYFNAKFRKYVGMSPTAYRKEC
ncbi:response regulator transcription factor [Paenibacillus spiritus]|nr:response regulator transcription factor [Paenibacillus spiritus]